MERSSNAAFKLAALGILRRIWLYTYTGSDNISHMKINKATKLCFKISSFKLGLDPFIECNLSTISLSHQVANMLVDACAGSTRSGWGE